MKKIKRKQVVKIKDLLTNATLACCLVMSLTGCGYRQNAIQNNEMGKRIINPWTWQYKHGLSGFVHANEVTNARRTFYTAGIVSVDDDGNLRHPGDMAKQINQIFDNMETLFTQAEFKFSDVVQFTYYTTDIQAFKSKAVQHVLIRRLKKAGCNPATSLIGVHSLFHPDCVVEVDAIAAD